MHALSSVCMNHCVCSNIPLTAKSKLPFQQRGFIKLSLITGLHFTETGICGSYIILGIPSAEYGFHHTNSTGIWRTVTYSGHVMSGSPWLDFYLGLFGGAPPVPSVWCYFGTTVAGPALGKLPSWVISVGKCVLSVSCGLCWITFWIQFSLGLCSHIILQNRTSWREDGKLLALCGRAGLRWVRLVRIALFVFHCVGEELEKIEQL